MSLSLRMASASGVVGPFAPSARIRQRRCAAFDEVMTRSRAAGTRMVQGTLKMSAGYLLRTGEFGERFTLRNVAAKSDYVDAALVADGAGAVADGQDAHAAADQFLTD